MFAVVVAAVAVVAVVAVVAAVAVVCEGAQATAFENQRVPKKVESLGLDSIYYLF